MSRRGENIYRRKPCFGNRQISDISTDEVTVFFSDLLESGAKSGAGLSSSTVRLIRTIISEIRNYATEQGYYISFSLSQIRLKSQQPDYHVFTRDEFMKLSEYLITHMNRIYLGILLCLYTGIRIGELCALNYKDIDFGNGIIRISHTIERVRIKADGKYISVVRLYEPKSISSRREVPIPDDLMDTLREYYVEDAYLLTGNTDKFMEPRSIQRRFHTVLKSAGIADVKFHTTRHSFSTRCVECGVEAKALSEMLGHTNVAFTLQRYYHPSLDVKRKNINLLSELLPVIEDRQKSPDVGK